MWRMPLLLTSSVKHWWSSMNSLKIDEKVLATANVLFIGLYEEDKLLW